MLQLNIKVEQGEKLRMHRQHLTWHFLTWVHTSTALTCLLPYSFPMQAQAQQLLCVHLAQPSLSGCRTRSPSLQCSIQVMNCRTEDVLHLHNPRELLEINISIFRSSCCITLKDTKYQTYLM